MDTTGQPKDKPMSRDTYSERVSIAFQLVGVMQVLRDDGHIPEALRPMIERMLDRMKELGEQSQTEAD